MNETCWPTSSNKRLHAQAVEVTGNENQLTDNTDTVRATSLLNS